MTDLTEKSLEKMLVDIREYLKTEKPNARPTKVLYQPAALKSIGLTHDDVLKLIKENT
jgi:hypothetical protein